MHHNDVFSGVKCTKGGAGGELTGYYGGAKGRAAAIKFSKDNPGLALKYGIEWFGIECCR